MVLKSLLIFFLWNFSFLLEKFIFGNSLENGNLSKYHFSKRKVPKQSRTSLGKYNRGFKAWSLLFFFKTFPHEHFETFLLEKVVLVIVPPIFPKNRSLAPGELSQKIRNS